MSDISKVTPRLKKNLVFHHNLSVQGTPGNLNWLAQASRLGLCDVLLVTPAHVCPLSPKHLNCSNTSCLRCPSDVKDALPFPGSSPTALLLFHFLMKFLMTLGGINDPSPCIPIQWFLHLLAHWIVSNSWSPLPYMDSKLSWAGTLSTTFCLVRVCCVTGILLVMIYLNL